MAKYQEWCRGVQRTKEGQQKDLSLLGTVTSQFFLFLIYLKRSLTWEMPHEIKSCNQVSTSAVLAAEQRCSWVSGVSQSRLLGEVYLSGLHSTPNLKKNTFNYFRAVLGSQQNWTASAEIPCTSCTPPHICIASFPVNIPLSAHQSGTFFFFSNGWTYIDTFLPKVHSLLQGSFLVVVEYV